MTIRRATVADIESILLMQRQVHSDHVSWDSARWTVSGSIESSYRGWLSRLTAGSEDALALVASDANRPVGYLIAEVEPESTHHWSPKAVYLHDLFVDPAHRRAGFARKLMHQLLAWSAEHHPGLQLRLITAAQNEAARKFFERFGFRQCVVELVREM